MKCPLTIASFAALGLLLNTVSAVDEARINGWYPCAESTFHGPTNTTTLKDMALYECSELEVPLCYDDICKSDRKINVFVKRRVGKTASKDPNVPRKAALLVQGGPGESSEAMESYFATIVDPADDTIDIYTFDHRGTGRSEYLQCDAAAALTPGSPDGTKLATDELPTCLEDLAFQYDGQAAAFSTTSAAMDVRMIIDTFLANHHVYISAYSYGTFLAQRLLQLKVPQIQGYIFDGVDALTTKSDPLESANSHWNEAMKGPSRRLLEFCFDDPKCPIKMKSRETVLDEVLAAIDKLDDGTNACGKLAAQVVGVEKPSEAVRFLFYNDAAGFDTRAKGLEVLGAVLRCKEDEMPGLKVVLGVPETNGTNSSSAPTVPPPTPAPLDVLGEQSSLLYDVVVFSERWARPAPTREQRNKFIHDTAAANNLESLAYAYCVFTGSTEPACTELKDELPAPGNKTFFYKRDKYFDAPVTLPDHASALVINGGLDFATPMEFGQLLYSKLKGSGKGVMMVNLDYGRHCAGERVLESPDAPCRDSIMRQFIVKGGDVDAIDLKCMNDLPATAFHVEEKWEREQRAAADGEDDDGEEE